MIKPVILVGAGGHASVIADSLKRDERTVLGVVNPTPPQKKKYFGFDYLGTDEVLSDYVNRDVELVNGIGILPNYSRRKEISKSFGEMGFVFATIIDPTVIIGSGVEIGQGAQIMAGVILQANSVIGRDCIINTGAYIDHDCTIGDQSCVAPGAVLCGNLTIGNDVFLGASACVLQGIEVGNDVVVGAGVTVRCNISTGCRVT